MIYIRGVHDIARKHFGERVATGADRATVEAADSSVAVMTGRTYMTLGRKLKHGMKAWLNVFLQFPESQGMSAISVLVSQQVKLMFR